MSQFGRNVNKTVSRICIKKISTATHVHAILHDRVNDFNHNRRDKIYDVSVKIVEEKVVKIMIL